MCVCVLTDVWARGSNDRFQEKYDPTQVQARADALAALAREGYAAYRAEWDAHSLRTLSLDETATMPLSVPASAPAPGPTAEGADMTGDERVLQTTDIAGEASGTWRRMHLHTHLHTPTHTHTRTRTQTL
jgi:hypothetical protein